MENEKTFRTKTGFCHVLPDRIVLTRDGIIGNVSKVVVGNTSSRILLIYGGLSIFLLYFAYDNYSKDKLFLSLMFVIIGMFLIIGIIKSLNNSATPIIERSKIQKIKFKKGITGLTRSRFEVLFLDEQRIKILRKHTCKHTYKINKKQKYLLKEIYKATG